MMVAPIMTDLRIGVLPISIGTRLILHPALFFSIDLHQNQIARGGVAVVADIALGHSFPQMGRVRGIDLLAARFVALLEHWEGGCAGIPDNSNHGGACWLCGSDCQKFC